MEWGLGSLQWRKRHLFSELPGDFNFETVDMSGDIIVATGFTGGIVADKAAAVIGRRIT